MSAPDSGAPRVATAGDGTDLAYRLRGSGPPLLLLPGQANDHTWWDRVAPELARHHTLVLVDPRGTGASGAGPDGGRSGYSTRGLAEDALAVLDHAGIGRTHVYGASMGGRVAQWNAADHPERVGALVLGCTSPGGEHGVERSAEVRASLAVRDEDPQRPWDDLGEWWPDSHPGVIGIRDRRAGGAWLAADPASGRLAVLLNRADVLDLPDDAVRSRGSLALESVAGRSPDGPLPMHGFNLLGVTPDGSRVLSWDGTELRESSVPEGVHMIAHDDLDDPRTARIVAWLPRFAAVTPARAGEVDLCFCS